MKKSAHITLTILLIGGLFIQQACKSRKNNEKSGSAAHEINGFDDYFIDATTHFNNNHFESAQKLYEKCLNIKEDVPSVHYQLSRIEMRNSKVDKAIHYASKANQLDPKNVYYAVWLAQLYSKNGEKNNAIPVLEASYKQNQKNELLVNSLDTLYRLTGQIDKNIELWKTFISNKGFNLKYANNLIALYKSKKDYVNAHKIYDEIKKAAPAKVKYYIEDGNLYLDENNEERAMQNFKKALEIQPDNFNLNVSMFRFQLKKKDNASAKNYLLNAIGDPSTDFQAKSVFLSEVKIKMNEDSSFKKYAPELANNLRNLYPGNKLSLMASAEFYSLSSDKRNAYLSYRRVTFIDPNLFDAWTGSFKNSSAFRSADTINNLTDNVREYFPFASIIFIESANASFGIEDYKSAIKTSETGMNYASSNDDRCRLLFIKAKAQLASGAVNESKATLHQGLDINPDDSALNELMGDILMKEGNKTEALKFWNKSKVLGNNSETLNKKIKS